MSIFLVCQMLTQVFKPNIILIMLICQMFKYEKHKVGRKLFICKKCEIQYSQPLAYVITINQSSCWLKLAQNVNSNNL